MAMGKPTMIQFRKLIVSPVAPVSTPMATMLNELPARRDHAADDGRDGNADHHALAKPRLAGLGRRPP